VGGGFGGCGRPREEFGQRKVGPDRGHHLESPLHARNAEDYRAFLGRLGIAEVVDTGPFSLAGPFLIPGVPTFRRPPTLLVGKVTTNCKGLGA
jgi:hypothetical protein